MGGCGRVRMILSSLVHDCQLSSTTLAHNHQPNEQDPKESNIDYSLLNTIQINLGCLTPYANVVDHSVVSSNELYESEASWALMLCFDNASSKKPCFVDDLVCVILLCLRVFVLLNATSRDRNCPAFASEGKRVDPCNSLRRRKWVHGCCRNWTLILFVTFLGWKTFNRKFNSKSSKWQAYLISMTCTFPKVKKKLLLKVVYVQHHFIQSESSTKQILQWYHQGNELQLPPSLKPVKVLSQMIRIWS